MANWTAWAENAPSLSASARRTLSRELGNLTPAHVVPLERVDVPPSRLDPDVRRRLVEGVGAGQVHDDDATRARHAGGQSYADLLRRRRGDATAAADAVVTASAADDVRAVLA